MAIDHSLTVRYYLRMLAWVFILYVLWCFAPTLFSEARFRVQLFQTVNEGASSGQTPAQIRETLLGKADALRLPLTPDELEVSAIENGGRISAHYSYRATVTCFKQSVDFDFSSSHSAESITRFQDDAATGN